MNKSTKQLFDAPWKAEEYKHGKGAFVVRNNSGYLVAENMSEQDAKRTARLPELYDALMEEAFHKCFECMGGLRHNIDLTQEDLIENGCPKQNKSNVCIYVKHIELLRKVRTIAGITVGSCACYDDFHSVYRDWVSFGDRILNIVGLLPRYADGQAFRIEEWYLKNDTSEDKAVIHVRFGWEDENGCMLCTVEFPAKYLFMSDEEIIADWNARIKAFEDAKQQEKQDARYREFLNIKERYLTLKEEFEPEESDQ